MAENSHLSIQEIYQNLLIEADELEKKVKDNLFHISEIDKYLNSILDKEEEDFKVFSPRNVESIYKNDIEIHNKEKQQLEADNKVMYTRLSRIHECLITLKEVIEEKPTNRNYEVLDIQEKERQRIARDLHDTSLQNLAHLVHKIELASMYIDKDSLQAKLELAAINKNLKAVIEEIRNTIFDLRPMTFDDLGLKETFERLFTNLKNTNKAFDFETKIDVIKCDNNIILMTIFRVVQEACSNAIKHSGGNKIKVVIEQKGYICEILVKDNGSGFSTENGSEYNSDKHFGIAVMKERVNLLGGKISFYSNASEGTEIRMCIPLY